VRHQTLIREARKRAGLTQADIARRLGTTQSAVARWEKGAASPRFKTLERVARACGLELAVPLVTPEAPDRDQIAERLRCTPKQRLDYLRDMIAFEKRAHRAKRVGKS